MTRCVLPRFNLSLLVGLLASVMLVHCVPPLLRAATNTSDQEIRQLIADLGSGCFKDRDRATRKLTETAEAEPALRKALISADVEVKRRAAGILLSLERKHALYRLAKAKALGADGRAIEIADRMVYARKWATGKQGWSAITHLADKLIDLTAKDMGSNSFFRRIPKFPAGDFQRYINAVHPVAISRRKLVIPSGGNYILSAENVSFGKNIADNLVLGIVVSSGNVQVSSLFESIIIAGGDIKVGAVRMSIIVCDGDVELTGPESSSIIIARGKVISGKGNTHCSVVRSEKYYQFYGGERIEIKDKASDPLGFVKFFELADVGLAVAERDSRKQPIDEGVQIKNIHKGSPFAPGLRVGDVVTALDGTKVISPESFRQLLRRKLAQNGMITFSVRRAEKLRDVVLLLKD